MTSKVFIALPLLVLGGCAAESAPGEYPVDVLSRRGSTFHIEAAPSVRLGELMFLDLFADFKPDESLDSILPIHGTPSEIARPNRGEEYYVYNIPAGLLWTGYQRTADGDVHRLVQLHPASLALSGVLRQPVRRQLPPLPPSSRILLYLANEKGPAARVELASDSVIRLLWFGSSTPGDVEPPLRFPG